MPPFAARARRVPGSRRALVPSGFEALFDALESDLDVTEAVTEIARRAAREGVSLDEVFADLAVTYEAHGGIFVEPPFSVVRASAGAWADASLRYLHNVSCEDPLTGLASLSHVRTRIVETYREHARRGVQGPPPHAMLVVELSWAEACSSPLDRMLRLIDVAEILRMVYAGDEAVGQLTTSRVVALVHRDDRIGDSVSSLLGLLQNWEDRTGISTRLWIEGLPASPDSAEALLDELAR